jgi:peptidoglycan-N-acetylglucosamine deacetylase
MIIRRYHAILLGSTLLLCGAVSYSSREPYRFELSRPEVNALPPRPWVALTFDDGPHPVMTQKLLDVLQIEGTPATFFIVGKMAVRYPQVVQDMARLGHEVANHTFSHPRLPKGSTKFVLNELAQTRSLIARLTGRDTPLYRPPGGYYSKRTVRVAEEAGYQMVLWSVLPKDVNGASIPVMKERIYEQVADGGIVLLHSGIPNTVEMLPDVIRTLKAQGYRFVTVSQILGLEQDRQVHLPPLPQSSVYPIVSK